MGKTSFAEAKRKMMDKFREKREKEKRIDMEFPASNNDLQRRVVTSTSELSVFVKHHLFEAERAVVVDTENYVYDRRFTLKNMPATWSWHEQSLVARDVANSELSHRSELQKLLRKSFSKL